MQTILTRFFKVEQSERNQFLVAFITTTIFSLLLAFTPKRFVLKRIGSQGVESPSDISEENRIIAGSVAKSIRRTTRYSPWRVTCFAKGIAAKYLLKRKGIASTLYLGIAKDGVNKLTAHAWLRCGSVIITGKEEMNRFTTITFFT